MEINKYCFFLFLMLSINVNGQRFLDFVQTVKPDSVAAALKNNLSPIDELKTSITLVKGSQFNSDHNYLLLKIDYLSDSLQVPWGRNMYHYLKATSFGIQKKDSSATYFLKALEGFKSEKDTSGMIMCHLKLFYLHFNITNIEIAEKKSAQKHYEEFLKFCALSNYPHDKLMLNYAKMAFNGFDKKLDLEEIEKLHKESISIIESNKEIEFFRINANNALELEYTRLKMYDKAQSLAFETMNVLKGQHSKLQDMALYNFASSLYLNGDKNLGMQYLHKLLDSFDYKSSFAPEIYKHACHTLIEEYSKKNDTKQIMKLYQLRNAIINYNNDKLRARDLLEFEQNLEMTNRKLRTKAIENERNNLKRALILFGILMIIVLFLATRLYFTKNKLNQSKLFAESILYILAHDLKSPLLAFSMALKRMNRQLQENKTEEVQEDIKHLRVSSINGINLIENLLGLHTSNTLEKENISLKKFVTDSLQHLLTITTIKNIQTKIEIPENIEISCYRVHLSQILRNLVDNAAKHSGCTEIVLDGFEDNNKFIINVRDNGKNYQHYVNEISKMVAIINDENSPVEITSNQLGTRIIKAGLNKLNSKLSFKRVGEWSIFSFEIA